MASFARQDASENPGQGRPPPPGMTLKGGGLLKSVLKGQSTLIPHANSLAGATGSGLPLGLLGRASTSNASLMDPSFSFARSGSLGSNSSSTGAESKAGGGGGGGMGEAALEMDDAVQPVSPPRKKSAFGKGFGPPGLDRSATLTFHELHNPPNQPLSLLRTNTQRTTAPAGGAGSGGAGAGGAVGEGGAGNAGGADSTSRGPVPLRRMNSTASVFVGHTSKEIELLSSPSPPRSPSPLLLTSCTLCTHTHTHTHTHSLSLSLSCTHISCVYTLRLV